MNDFPEADARTELDATKAALAELRELVAKETAALLDMADDGLEDDAVFFAIRRLILILPAEMRPRDPTKTWSAKHVNNSVSLGGFDEKEAAEDLDEFWRRRRRRGAIGIGFGNIFLG